MSKPKKKSQIRSADPDAIRATVYFPADTHEAMSKATEAIRKERRAEREKKTGPREYERVTLSAVIVEVCQEWLSKLKPKRKAA